MTTERWMQRGLGHLLCLLVWHFTGSAFARPRPPGPPYPEMGVLNSIRFDSTNLLTDSKSDLLLQDVALVESWSGYALSMEGKEPKMFVIPAVDSNGKTNLTSTAGTIRFWFRPSWSSINLGGNGPGVPARLFEVGAWSQNQSVGWWSLQLSQGGDEMSFVAGSKGECLDILRASIQWKEGDWHQVALSYSPNGSWLFLDGQLVAQGQAVALLPLERFNGVFGLCLGSDAQGLNVAQGQFDELTTFKLVQDADHVAWNYSCFAGFAVLGPITPEEDAARLQRMLALRAARLGTTDAPMMALDSVPPPPGGGGGGTNGPPSTNSWAWATGFDHGTDLCFWSIGYVLTNMNATAYLTIANNDPTKSYDLYVTTNLCTVTLWSGVTQGIAWTFLTTLPAGCTNVTITGVSDMQCFYALAAHQDSDGDGVTDGDEIFLYRTDPLVFFFPDTDGDGMPDLWEILHNLNPTVSDANSDPDGDGLTNLQEFRAGTDPLAAPSFEIQITQPQTRSNLP